MGSTVSECVHEMCQPTRGRTMMSVAQIADALHVAPVTVYKWGDVDNGNNFPACQVGRLTHLLGDDLLIQKLCEDAGGMFIPAPKPDRRGSRKDLGKAITRFGEFVLEAENDAADGVISAKELARIEADAMAAMRAIQSVVMDARELAASYHKGTI